MNDKIANNNMNSPVDKPQPAQYKNKQDSDQTKSKNWCEGQIQKRGGMIPINGIPARCVRRQSNIMSKERV